MSVLQMVKCTRRTLNTICFQLPYDSVKTVKTYTLPFLWVIHYANHNSVIKIC